MKKARENIEVVRVPLAALRPNNWNPNVMDEETYEKEKRSITDHGFIDPLTVRVVAGVPGYEIVDGYHRWRAAQDLGLPEVPCVNLGAIDDQKAKKLTIIANELRGRSEPVKLANLVADLAKLETTEELARSLPMRAAELDALIASVATYDWQAAADAAGGQRGDAVQEHDVDFRLGPIHGPVPKAVAERLLKVWEGTASAVGSRTPAAVLERWCESLLAPPEAS